MSREPHAIVFPLEKPVTIAGEARDRLYVESFGFNPGLGPREGSPLKVVLATSFRRWEQLAMDPEAYQAEKARIAETVIGLLEPRFPGLRRQIRAVDVGSKRIVGSGSKAYFLRYQTNGDKMPIRSTLVGWGRAGRATMITMLDAVERTSAGSNVTVSRSDPWNAGTTFPRATRT